MKATSRSAAPFASAKRAPFVGREAELRDLRSALAGAFEGAGGLYLIAGEPGIGKTRLAREIANEAAERGAGVLEASSSEGAGAPPYWPWAQALRGRRAPAELEAPLADLPTPGSLASEEARFRLFEAVAGVLRETSRSEPLLVFLDDLQWADDSSLFLLQFLARNLECERILFLGAYRDVEARLDPRKAERMTALVSGARTIALRGLAVSEVGPLLERTTGLAVAAGVAQGIERATGGNPLFVKELARLLDSEGRLDQPVALSSQGVPLPDRVRALLRRRLGMLSAPCQRVLTVAAVLGRDFDLAPLGEVATAVGDRPREALDEARGAGLVVEDEGRFAFVHDLVREALYDGVDDASRRRLHGEIGAALERIHAGHLELRLTELAHHFSIASTSGAAQKAVEYSARAGERATRHFAYAEAAGHYERALRALAATGSVDPARRCRLLLALGESLWSAGGFERARQIYGEAAELAEALGLSEELARAALGFGGHDVAFDAGVVDERLVALLEKGLQVLGEVESPLGASLTGRLATALAFGPDRERASVLAERAVEIARRSGDRATLYFVLNCWHHASWTPDNLSQRLATSREIVAIAEEIGVGAVAEAHAAGLLDLLEAGDVAAVDREVAAFERRARIAERRLSSWIVVVRRAMVALLEGRLPEAEAQIFEALRLGQAAQNRNAGQVFGLQMLALSAAQGRLAEIVEAVAERVSAYPAVPAWRAALAWVRAEIGQSEEARREIDHLAAADFADLPRDIFWLAALWALSEAVFLLDDRDRADLLYPLLEPFAERFMTATIGVSCGSLQRSLGLLAATCGRSDAAVRHFEAATLANARMRAKPWVARSEYDLARVLVERSSPGDRERATELLGRALDAARSTAMASLVVKAETLLGELAAARPCGADEAIFRREGEYWTIAYGGRSARLRDARGLRLIALLLGSPGREFGAAELAAWPEPPRAPGTQAERIDSDLHVTVAESPLDQGADSRARAEYRSRLRRLDEEVAEAESSHDSSRAARAREEIAALSRELAASCAGRSRRRDLDRPRLAVTKAIRYAIGKVERAHPELGRTLAATVKTGSSCRYEPDPRHPLRWTF